MKEAQTKQILAHLKAGKPITPLEALEQFNCLRLAARVKNLRDEGHQIQRVMVRTESGKRFARYSL